MFLQAAYFLDFSIVSGSPRAATNRGIQLGSLAFLYKFRSVLERTEDLIQPNQSGNKRFNPLEGYFEPKARESRTRHNRPARRWTSRVQMYCSGLDSSRHG